MRCVCVCVWEAPSNCQARGKLPNSCLAPDGDWPIPWYSKEMSWLPQTAKIWVKSERQKYIPSFLPSHGMAVFSWQPIQSWTSLEEGMGQINPHLSGCGCLFSGPQPWGGGLRERPPIWPFHLTTRPPIPSQLEGLPFPQPGEGGWEHGGQSEQVVSCFCFWLLKAKQQGHMVGAHYFPGSTPVLTWRVWAHHMSSLLEQDVPTTPGYMTRVQAIWIAPVASPVLVERERAGCCCHMISPDLPPSVAVPPPPKMTPHSLLWGCLFSKSLDNQFPWGHLVF